MAASGIKTQMKYYAYIKFLYDGRCFIEHIFASLIRSLTDINFNEHYLISQRVLNVYVAAFTVSLVDRGFTIANDSIITNTSIPAANPRVEKPQWEKLSEIVNRV